MLKNKIKAFSVLAFVLAISLSLFGLSLDKPSGFVFAAEAKNSSSEENTTEANAVAKIGNTEYKTLAEAVAAAKAGETVTLVADYNVEKNDDTVENQNIVGVDMTLDLNGHKITFFAEMSEYKNNHVAIYVKNGATFTVTDSSAGGNGGIISALDKSSKPGDNIGPYTFDVVDNSNLIINGGYYLGGGTVAQIETGKVTVNGGVFEINPYGKPYYYDFMFNCIDSAYIDGTATIEVNGGTFKNWDPFNSAGDKKAGVNARFTMKGVGVTKNSDGDYVATSGKVAQVVDVNGDSVAAYATLAEAVAAAKKGETVTLVADTAENVTINKNLTLDLGNYTLFSGDKDVVFTVEKGNVIINAGKGGIRGGSGSNNVAIKVTEGNLTINGGNYYVGGDAKGEGNSTVYIAGTGTVTINGGVFETEKSWKDFYYVLNIQNECAGTFTVCGGTFVNYDPTVGDDNMHGNFVAAGHKAILEVKEEKNYYTVKSYQVAKIGDNVYDSLKDAVAAAKKGETITLCSDYYDYSKVSAGIVYNIAGITLDLNGYTYISENFGHVFEGTDGLITNGKMVCNKGSSYALFVGGDEEETIGFTVKNVEFEGGINVYNASGVVLENCTVQGTNYYAVWLDEGAFVTIKSGEYKAGTTTTVGVCDGSSLKIEGGTFDIKSEFRLEKDKYKGEILVSGGTFVGNEPNLTKDNFAKGFTLAKNDDGTYGVIECSTLKEYLVNLGTSITLKIGVNEVGKNVKVTYAYNGGEEAEIKKHVDGFYYIENITPQIIDRVYTVKVYEGETVVDSKELSVLGYCDTLLGTTTATEKAKTAVKALVYYGQKAKDYLGMTESADISAVISKYNLTPDELTAPEKKVVSTGTELLISSVALNVSDKNAIVYYMTKENFEIVYATDSKYTVTVGGVKVEKGAWSESGEYYVYKGADIYAAELGTQVEVIVNDGANDVQKLVYGAYDYCASKWNDTKVGAIARAIYAYGVACAEYKAK